MAKKKTQAPEEFHGESHAMSPMEVVPMIVPLSIDTGREDLNTIVAKINEVISFLNR